MKKLNALLVLVVSIGLFSCGGGASSTTVDFKSDGTFLKDFTHKSTKILKGGMVWNAEDRHQTLVICVSNAETIELASWGGFSEPKNEGEAIIVLKLAGKLFEKGGEPVLIKEGDEFVAGTQPDYVLSCSVSLPNKKSAMFNGERSAATQDFEGTAKITKMDENLVEGEINFKRVDGTSSITVKFSEPFVDNWTGKGFDE